MATNGTTPNNGRLADKVALITGGTSGIGLATARAFVQEGAIVVITGRRANLGNDIVAEFEETGGQARYIKADHTRPADCENVVDQTIADFGRVDILFNNAGVGAWGTAEETSEADWSTIFDLNVTAVWRMSRLVIPHMRAQSRGSIVNNASHWGLIAYERRVAYCASKGAVIQMTKAMALDHARDSIRVNAVCPGDVLVEHRREGGDFQGVADADLSEAMRKAGDYIPIGRVAYAEEVGKAVLFLASDDSSYVTGTTLLVDGGNTAR